MAARKLRPRHTDEIRQKIQTSQLVNRLTDHALGSVEMSSTQIRAAEILLSKSLGDAPKIVEGPGDDGEHKLVIEVVRFAE